MWCLCVCVWKLPTCISEHFNKNCGISPFASHGNAHKCSDWSTLLPRLWLLTCYWPPPVSVSPLPASQYGLLLQRSSFKCEGKC